MAVSFPTLAGSDSQTKAATTQPFAGEAPVVAGNAPALADIDQYELCALVPTGITPYVDATHEPQMAVIASVGVVSGKACPYYSAGHFNHAAITWPAEYDTLPKRKALLVGSGLHVTSLLPADL